MLSRAGAESRRVRVRHAHAAGHLLASGLHVSNGIQYSRTVVVAFADGNDDDLAYGISCFVACCVAQSGVCCDERVVLSAAVRCHGPYVHVLGDAI